MDIYAVLENRGGVIISYNYDGIADRQRSFPVLAPHGRRPAVLDSPPRLAEAIRQMARENRMEIPTDWHLPVPEDESVRSRADYRRAVRVWQNARCILLVGYGFGGGDDGLSFEDFGRRAAAQARVHILCSHPDNRDLRRQVGYALRGRGPRFRVFGQPFRWRSFAEALLHVLAVRSATHVSAALGLESELCQAHDAR